MTIVLGHYTNMFFRQSCPRGFPLLGYHRRLFLFPCLKYRDVEDREAVQEDRIPADVACANDLEDSSAARDNSAGMTTKKQAGNSYEDACTTAVIILSLAVHNLCNRIRS